MRKTREKLKTRVNQQNCSLLHHALGKNVSLLCFSRVFPAFFPHFYCVFAGAQCNKAFRFSYSNYNRQIHKPRYSSRYVPRMIPKWLSLDIGLMSLSMSAT